MADESLAFASLLSERAGELGLSAAEIADEVDVPTASVDDWIAGEAIPIDELVEPLGRALALPRSLIREAIRRSDVSPLPFRAPEAVVDDATLEEVIPLAVAVVEDPPTSEIPDAAERVVDRLARPFRALSERFARRRSATRLPTRERSYLEDDEQLMTYRLRAFLTAGGVVILVVVLRWALRGFGGALSDVWETLTGAL